MKQLFSTTYRRFRINAQVLYSDNFAEGFAAEDRVASGDILITTIKANME